MEKKDIASYTLQELEDEMKAIGEKPFRAKQIYEWIHVKLVESFDEMTNVSKLSGKSWTGSMRSRR